MTPATPDPFLALTDEARVEQAIAMRSAEHGRLDRSSETATWVGTLRDLAEARGPVVIRSAGDRTTRGILFAVGSDHVVVRRCDGVTVLLALGAVRSVCPRPGLTSPVAAGDRPAPHGRTFAEVLARLLEIDAEVAVVLRDTTEPMSGRIVGFGEDVLSVRLPASEHAMVYIPLIALVEVQLRV